MEQSLITIIQKYGVENLGRYYSVYRAIVIDNVDPDKSGKIKVNIPGIFDGLTIWARPRNFQGTINSGMKSLTPRPGDVVFLEMERGDPFKALWSLHPCSETEGLPEDLDEETMGIVTPSGNKLLLKEKDGELIVELIGKFKINSAKGGSITSNGTIEVKSEEKIIANEGNNRGLVNIAQVESLVKALAKDLIIASSGQNLSTWMASEMPKMEDTKFTH